MKEPLSREELMAQARQAARSTYSLLIQPADSLTPIEACRLLEYSDKLRETALEFQKRPVYKRGI